MDEIRQKTAFQTLIKDSRSPEEAENIVINNAEDPVGKSGTEWLRIKLLDPGNPQDKISNHS